MDQRTFYASSAKEFLGGVIISMIIYDLGGVIMIIYDLGGVIIYMII